MPLASDQEGPAPPELSASSGFVVAHCSAIPRGRTFPADFMAAAASSDFAVTIYFAFPRGRTSPTDFAAVVAAALVVPVVPDQDDPAFTNSVHDCCDASTVSDMCSVLGPSSPEDTAIWESVVGTLLHAARRPSFIRRPCDIGVCRGHSGSQSQEAELRQQILHLLQQRLRWHCLWSKMNQHHLLTWRCSLHSQETELEQQALRLLQRRRATPRRQQDAESTQQKYGHRNVIRSGVRKSQEPSALPDSAPQVILGPVSARLTVLETL